MNENINTAPIDDKKTISILKRRVSHLRFVVYVALAICVLSTTLFLSWSFYSEQESLETFYSKAPQPPQAALYLSPREGRYVVGDEFAIDVLVNTRGSNVNAVASYLSYDTKNLKVLSIDISNSIFTMPAEQAINETDGKIKITLGIPTPGVNTNNGKVVTIHFKALNKIKPLSENIYFDFTKGSDLYSGVYLNDKKGTNTLSAIGGTKIFID